MWRWAEGARRLSPDCSGNLAADHGLINKACERPADNGADRRYTRPLHPYPSASLRGRVRLPVTPHTRFGARLSSHCSRFGAVCRHTVHTFVARLSSHCTPVLGLSSHCTPVLGPFCRHTIHLFWDLSTETVRTGSVGRTPRLSHSSGSMLLYVHS